jgi:hypothetical protein
VNIRCHNISYHTILSCQFHIIFFSLHFHPLISQSRKFYLLWLYPDQTSTTSSRALDTISLGLINTKKNLDIILLQLCIIWRTICIIQFEKWSLGYKLKLQQIRVFYFFFMIYNHLIPKGRGSGNSEFGHKVSKVGPKIVPMRNQIQILPNNLL